MLFKREKNKLYLKILVEAPEHVKKNKRINKQLLKVRQMIFNDLKWMLNKREFTKFKEVFVRVQIYLEEEKEEDKNEF